MNVWQSLAISRSGMDLEQLRVEIAARNIAAANQPAIPGRAAYQPLRLLAQHVGHVGFDATLLSQLAGVQGHVVPSTAPPRQVHDPAHPLANAQGLVEYPGVNIVEEMLALTMGIRTYEANITAFNASRAMALKAMSLGGRRG